VAFSSLANLASRPSSLTIVSGFFFAAMGYR
jgi:hypothetical protein